MDVFISIHVRSMAGSARVLKDFLVANGFKVWVCIDMEGGVDYREEIVKVLKSCKIFLPLMNDQWASSGECKDEYSLAKRLNLTSLEKGITQIGESRIPAIVPVAFPNLTWDAYPHVELLSASTNFILHPSDTLLENSVPTLTAIATAINNLRIPHLPRLPSPESAPRGSTKAVGQSLAPPESLRNGAKYFGTSTFKGKMNDGHTYQSWQSIEFEIESVQSNGSVHCTIIYTQLRSLVDGSPELSRNPPLPLYLQRYIQDIGQTKETCEGTYDATTGLLQLQGVKVEILKPITGNINTSKFVLACHGDVIAGARYINNTTSTGPASFVMKAFA